MRMRILLLNNSMPLTIYICLLAYALLCSSISCFRPSYDVCNGVRKCGRLHFGYPFGEKDSGCGDPEFQLDDCHHQDRFPLLNISGYQYRVLEPSLLQGNNNTTTIINDNLWGGKCNLSGNYSQFWLSGSHFHIADTYTNLTLWRDCDEKKLRNSQKLRICDAYWYRFSIQNSGASFCNTHLQVPIKKFLNETDPYKKSALKQSNQSFLGQGFQITWKVNPNRSRSCGACLNSNGSCGYDISKPTSFLCYCPDNTSHPSECPSRVNKTSSRSCVACLNSNGSCGYSISKPTTFLCHCPDNTSHPSECPSRRIVNKNSSHGNKTAIIIGCSVVGVAVTAIAFVLYFSTFYVKRRKPPPGSSTSKVEKFLKDYASEMPTRYSLFQLKKITNNFAERLGAGGYGVVYKGKLRSNEALVAVKILDRHKHSETQFMNEVATIGRLHHANVIRLLGYCFESPTSALLYEYMVNASLDKFLFTGKEEGHVLRWEQLYSIALGAARGIAYLHQDCDRRIIHFDIKPHNILLDADFTPKVSDFGLAKLCEKGDDHISMTGARGTPGYVAPELCDSHIGPVTDKSDVYSFGMLLLEIVGGRKNFDWKASRSSQFYFPEWAFKLLENGELGMRLRGEREMDAENEERARKLTKVGLWCIQYNPRDRPCMMRVVQMLEGNGDEVANPPFPINSSSTPETRLLSSPVNSSSIDTGF